jgi:hypothetical protein
MPLFIGHFISGWENNKCQKISLMEVVSPCMKWEIHGNYGKLNFKKLPITRSLFYLIDHLRPITFSPINISQRRVLSFIWVNNDS